MALSEREQRLLEEMERGLYQSEADVLQTGQGSVRRVNYRSLVLGIVVVLVGIGALIGGVSAHQLWLGMIGFAIMLGGVLLMFAKGSSAESVEMPQSGGGTRSGGAAQTESSSESFSERMERRWDERMGGER